MTGATPTNEEGATGHGDPFVTKGDVPPVIAATIPTEARITHLAEPCAPWFYHDQAVVDPYGAVVLIVSIGAVHIQIIDVDGNHICYLPSDLGPAAA